MFKVQEEEVFEEGGVANGWGKMRRWGAVCGLWTENLYAGLLEQVLSRCLVIMKRVSVLTKQKFE